VERSGQRMDREALPVDVTIVMPCLNEILSIRHCIANAKDALQRINLAYRLSGEIVIADNGSTDGSQALATKLGARVVAVSDKGYGAALIGGARAARGRFILMGDCDGSYDFTDGVAMIGKLAEGYALCMGSRFKGGIAKGAMPWKNRYIGNPVLTGILNVFFRTGINDAHCGLRAITKQAFLDLNLSGSGMEFASEMVIKASLKKMAITEVPATLSRDLRDRAPHLRPWRDGWRHLRYLLMLSPTWVFGVPALVSLTVGFAILLYALLNQLGVVETAVFGATWTILAGTMVIVGHMAGLFAVATHLYGVRAGYRLPHRWLWRFRSLLSLEGMLINGLALLLAGTAGLATTAVYWSASSYTALPSVLPVVIACCCGAMGMQNIFGGFLLAILGGHEAEFLSPLAEPEPAVASQSLPVRS
jgi:glycosyltransferase involved in cell wall biosynthesis